MFDLLKSIEKLLSSRKDMRVGNHSVCFPDMHIREFLYFGNCICRVNDREHTFSTDRCGYIYSSSTSRAIHDYQYYFGSVLGYTLISEE